MEDLQLAPTVYLLPECDNEEDRVPSSWPEERDLDVFDLWFECSSHSVVIDLSRAPLIREEI